MKKINLMAIIFVIGFCSILQVGFGVEIASPDNAISSQPYTYSFSGETCTVTWAATPKDDDIYKIDGGISPKILTNQKDSSTVIVSCGSPPCIAGFTLTAEKSSCTSGGDNPPCTPICTTGNKRCSSNKVQECRDTNPSDGCGDTWQDITTCQTSGCSGTSYITYQCTESGTTASCTSTISPNDARCTAPATCANEGTLQIDCSKSECNQKSCGTGCICSSSVKKETNCVDSKDNDGDGKTDTDDSDCPKTVTCANEGTSNIDCSKSECNQKSCGDGCLCINALKKEQNCVDKKDNDGDGKIDCTKDNIDPDCNCNSAEKDAPVIKLTSPANNFKHTEKEIVFKYLPSDASTITSCNLILNSVDTSADKTITKDEENFFKVTGLGSKDYKWQVECVDEFSNVGKSEERKLTVTLATPTEENINTDQSDGNPVEKEPVKGLPVWIFILVGVAVAGGAVVGLLLKKK